MRGTMVLALRPMPLVTTLMLIAASHVRKARAMATHKTPCYHVTTAGGEVYGVAATSKHDAMQLVQARLSAEAPATDRPSTATRVAMWEAEYGTVLHY